MATILAVAGVAAINALAFLGTNYVFSKLSVHGAAERKRHDLAIEQLSKDREKYNEERFNRLDFINRRLCEKQETREYISDMDYGMNEYHRVFGTSLPPLGKEPELSDYYQPSQTQRDGELSGFFQVSVF